MRLLNVDTLYLEEFMGEPGNGVPPYAILSHTWGQEEVTFHEMTSDCRALTRREGFQKIIGCCAKAKSEGYNFVWIDTICIDKSGSAELSEAINSMFRWYREANICYAYLEDVCSSENPANESSSFQGSRWFTRGWTLQELLAPYEVVFLAKDWKEIGTKRSLSSIISRRTKIDEKTLNDSTWDHASIACKMSWASSRKTTRQEDTAYCLMGLFGVNMPLIYGEGRNAFYRLQLEIMKSSDDQSIFAWILNDSSVFSYFRIPATYGLLAESPENFEHSHGIIDCPMTGGDTISYDVSKQYIQLSTFLLNPREKREIDGVEKSKLLDYISLSEDIRCDTTKYNRFQEELRGQNWNGAVMAILRCKDKDGYITIPIRRTDSGEFERFSSLTIKWLKVRTHEGLPPQKVLVRALGTQLPSTPDGRLPNFLIKSLPIETSGYYISSGYPPNFIAAPGERPTNSEAVARINKAIPVVAPIIVFFAHDLPEFLPFALRFDQIKSHGKDSCYIRCRVGPSTKDWEKGNLSASLQEDGKNVDVDGQIALYEDKSLFIRVRRSPPHCGANNLVNISIET